MFVRRELLENCPIILTWLAISAHFGGKPHTFLNTSAIARSRSARSRSSRLRRAIVLADPAGARFLLRDPGGRPRLGFSWAALASSILATMAGASSVPGSGYFPYQCVDALIEEAVATGPVSGILVVYIVRFDRLTLRPIK
jgi:hypothetical protein